MSELLYGQSCAGTTRNASLVRGPGKSDRCGKQGKED